MKGWGARGESTWSSETAEEGSQGYPMGNRAVWTLCVTVSLHGFSEWNMIFTTKKKSRVCVSHGYQSKCRNTRLLLLILLEVQLHSLENRILLFCLLWLYKAFHILFERENTKQFLHRTTLLNKNEWTKYLKYLRMFFMWHSNDYIEKLSP